MNVCHKKRNKSFYFLLNIMCLSVCLGILTNIHALLVSKNMKLESKLSFKVNDKQKAKYRIIITNHPEAFGEAQAVHRLIKAASNLGWEWAVADVLHLQPDLLKQLKPNFVLSLREENKPIKGGPHFLYLHLPLYMYSKEGKILQHYFPNLLAYDGYMQVIQDTDMESFKVQYLEKHSCLPPSVKSVFSVPSRDFQNSPKLRLCYWGSAWDKARGGEHYQRFYRLLDQTSYFDLYGPQSAWKAMHLTSYRGLLPADDHSVVDAISNCGIALVLHSNYHLKGGVPTSRIFEAAAASAVIICDHNSFVEKEFGDAVLYIDPNQNPEAVFKQIDDHVKWVHANPDKAMALARRSHAIFMERFTLENELKKIAKMYESMSQR
jgi:hypothetical protein